MIIGRVAFIIGRPMSFALEALFELNPLIAQDA